MKPVSPPPVNEPAAESRARNWFRRFASRMSQLLGSSTSFVFALAMLIVWGASYPLFRQMNNGFDTWQLIVNTITSVITFLMVFLIQNSQNRDNRAIQLKLDELVHAVQGARDKLMNLENCSDEELDTLQREFEQLRKARQAAAPTQP